MGHPFRAVAALSLAIGVFAQSEVGTASLTGTVTDAQGASVAAAKVTATNTQTGLARSTETSAAGLYNLVRLPVGSYSLTVELQGFKTFKQTGIQLAVGAVANLDARLEVGALAESVTVTSEVPVVETTRSQTSTTVNEKAVRDLPINGRNFLDFTVLTPGVVRDPRGGDLSFGGQRGTLNSLLIDGGDSNNIFFGQSSGRAGVRNPYTFSQDSVGEFQVNTNSYAAEIGRAGGGVVNVITKSGTNDFHGTAFWFHRNRPLNANTFFNNAQNRARQPYQFNQAGGNLGGPIVRNRLFFFANYDVQRNNTPVAVFYPIPVPSDAASQAAAARLAPFQAPYLQGLDNNIWTFKGDWNISNSQTLSVRYNYHRFTGQNFENGGPRSALERTGNSSNNTDNLAATYTKVFGSSVVWDARYIWLRDRAPGEANSPAPEAQIQQAGQLMIAIGRNNFSPRFTNTTRNQIIQTVSVNKGRHSFKFGGDLNLERIDNFFPGFFSGSYVYTSMADFVNNRPATYTQGFAGPGTNGPLTRPNVNEFAFFAQDSWRTTDRLTLNYGVRLDRFQYASGTVRNDNPGLRALGIDTAYVPPGTGFSGRFGFAYKVDRGGNFVIRGGIGNFFARVPGILTGTTHSQNGIQVQTFTLRSNIPEQAAIMPTYPNVLAAPPALARIPDIFVMEPGFQQPQTYQWSLNLETKLARDYAVTIGYLGVRGLHLSRTRDINLFPGAPVQSCFKPTTAATPCTAADTPVTFLRKPSARPNPAFGRISIFDSGGDSIYHGIFFQVTKRYAQNFQVQASYTFSKVIDTAPDPTSVTVGGGDNAKIVMDTLYPNQDRAVGNANVPNRFVISGLWDLNYAKGLANPIARGLLSGWQLSLIGQNQSGLPFSATTNVDINNDGNLQSDRTPGFGRNTFRGFSFTSIDARVSKDIPLVKERVGMRLMIEGFNLANKANFTTVNTTPFSYNAAANVFVPAPNFRLANNTADPRILQIAARITF